MMVVMARRGGWVLLAMAIAQGVLRGRETRRRLIFWVIVALLAVFALGNWPLAGWLEDWPMRFVLYWAGCMFLALFLFLLGLYDFLCVLKEHNERRM